MNDTECQKRKRSNRLKNSAGEERWETEKVKNEELYLRINERKTIWKPIREKMNKWIGHITKNHEWIMTIINEKIEGKFGRVIPRTLFMKQIIQDKRKITY